MRAIQVEIIEELKNENIEMKNDGTLFSYNGKKFWIRGANSKIQIENNKPRWANCDYAILLYEKQYFLVEKSKLESMGTTFPGDDDKGLSLDKLVEKIREVTGMSTMRAQLEKLIKAGNKQIILTGAPGTGKTYVALKFAKEKQEEEPGFVQFHPSYDYTDFVEGLRPVQLEKDGNPTFVRMDGAFKKFCRKVVEADDKNKKYYFIIDEINRADLSRVFGELMFCLEESYRNVPIQTQYQNLKTYEIKDGVATVIENDCFQDGFFIPENVYIIGTMNDIDRSVESFDFALRRRFRWVACSVAAELQDTNGLLKTADKNLITNIKNMNAYIAGEEGKKFNLNESYQIGPAYFKSLTEEESLKTIWENNIEPLLTDYCRGRDAKAFITKCKTELFKQESKGNAPEDENTAENA